MQNTPKAGRLRSLYASIKERLHPINQRYHLWWLAATIFLGIFFVLSAYLTINAKMANVSTLQQALEKSTVILDNQGKEAGSLFNQKGTYIKSDQISQNIKDAILSSEDRDFYSEPGFSIKGMARAFLLFLRNKLTGRNYISGGGSTITQQLAKNAYLSQEQTFTRKLKELFISIEIERKYTKEQILTMYLNNAYFGHSTWGVEDASQSYFGKPASQITTSEASMLAAILNSPGLYDPTTNYDAAKTRQETVLQTMVANKKITEDQSKKAAAAPLNLVNDFGSVSSSYDKYPWYFDSVINEAINRFGMSEADIMNRGYQIFTNMDQTDQANLQEDYANPYLFPVDDQSASIVMDAKTGGVRAIIGGRGEHVFRGFNRSTQAKRQPGSTIKPLAVYAPALSRGYFYDSMLPNHAMTFGKDKYEPKNAYETSDEDVPMYQALEYSYNIPAVWLLNKIGVNTGYTYVQRFGLTVTEKDKSLALALGGMNKGVSPMEMAQAYTSFANNGKMSQAHFINKIVDASGNVIASYTPETSQVISSKVAEEMTSMMIGTYTNGTGAAAKPYGIQLAGKTGTTEDVNNTGVSDASKDQWAIAYTPDFVVASWQGFDEDQSGQYLQLGIQSSLGPLFKTQASQLYQNSAQTPLGTTDANSRTTSSQNFVNELFGDFWGNVKTGWNYIIQKGNEGIQNIVDRVNNR